MVNPILRLSLLIAFLFSITAYAQKENYLWYFGKQAALSFSTNPPSILNNSAMLAPEGCASVSDTAGNLLFYTNGIDIWNKQHLIMPNGGTLYTGVPNASQSSIIIRNPANTNTYYLFTVNDGNNITLNYSIIDMNLSAGLGSVTARGFTLATGMTEKLTATKHCNGIDSWVLVHSYNSNNFLAFQISATGVNTTAIISSVGSVHSYSPQPASAINTTGCMKLSPLGQKLAVVKYTPGALELFDFNNATGVVSNPMMLTMTYSLGNAYGYGCEFSPDETKVYASGGSNGTLFQWDLCAGSTTAIAASMYALSPNINIIKSSLQLASNGKIYVARYTNSTSQNQLGVINNPNDAGSTSNYVDIGQSIGTATGQAGLPNFPTESFRLKPSNYSYTYTPLLSCATVSFSAPWPIAMNPLACTASSYSVLNQSWIFGDASSGAANTSSLSNPVHLFSNAGTYKVKLLLYYNCHCDTLSQMITVTKTEPNIGLSGKLNICAGQSTTLTGTGGISYQWSNVSGSSASVVVTPSISSTYTLTAYASGTPCPAVKIYTVNVSTCLGIINNTDELYIKIYPNPAHTFLNVETEQAIGLKIYNETGQLVYETDSLIGEKKLDISALKSGIYVIKYSSSKGSKALRFVKME